MQDNNGLTDEVTWVLNGPTTAPPEPGPSLPDRPADSASKDEWVDYCVALGADRTFLTKDTEHWHGDLATGHPVTAKALTKPQLIKLADRLGG